MDGNDDGDNTGRDAADRYDQPEAADYPAPIWAWVELVLYKHCASDVELCQLFWLLQACGCHTRAVLEGRDASGNHLISRAVQSDMALELLLSQPCLRSVPRSVFLDYICRPKIKPDDRLALKLFHRVESHGDDTLCSPYQIYFPLLIQKGLNETLLAVVSASPTPDVLRRAHSTDRRSIGTLTDVIRFAAASDDCTAWRLISTYPGWSGPIVSAHANIGTGEIPNPISEAIAAGDDDRAAWMAARLPDSMLNAYDAWVIGSRHDPAGRTVENPHTVACTTTMFARFPVACTPTMFAVQCRSPLALDALLERGVAVDLGAREICVAHWSVSWCRRHISDVLHGAQDVTWGRAACDMPSGVARSNLRRKQPPSVKEPYPPIQPLGSGSTLRCGPMRHHGEQHDEVGITETQTREWKERHWQLLLDTLCRRTEWQLTTLREQTIKLATPQLALALHANLPALILSYACPPPAHLVHLQPPVPTSS
jgi:hypothetical protein